MHIEDPVQVRTGWKVGQPVHHVRRSLVAEALVRLDHLGPVGRRLAEPALAVAADPGRVLEAAQPVERFARVRARGAVVPAEQPAVDPHGVRIGEHGVQRIHVSVDVIQESEHAH